MKLYTSGVGAALFLSSLPYILASNGQIPIQYVTEPQISSTNWTASMLALHKSLVEIESVSGHENEIGHFLKSHFESLNFTVITQTLPPLDDNPYKSPRFNVYAFNGRSPVSNVLVTSHMDTVPPFYNYTLEEGNEIWGRGAVDAKASIASQVTAALSLLESKQISRGDVSFLYVVGEEVGGDGMRLANELNLTWKAGIFGEPTELKLAAGHKGGLVLHIRAKGKAAHSGYPWLGDSANSKLIRALATLDKLELGYSEKYGNTTINIGRIEGGVAGNVVPESAKALIMFRIADGTTAEVRRKVEEAIGDEVELDWNKGYGPVDCDADVKGFETITVNYGTDVPYLQKKRLDKRYLYGPGSIFVAHSDHEHLNVKDLEEAVEGYKKLILHALKG